MKIGLFAENYYPYICGVSPILRTLLHRLTDEGHEVHLVVFNVERMYKANKDDKQIIMVDGMRLPKLFMDSFCTTVAFSKKKNLKKLEKYNFDIVHIHGEFSIAKLGVAYAKAHNIPIVYTWHSLWKDIMYKTAWFAGYIFSIYTEYHNIKRIAQSADFYTVPSMKVYRRALKIVKHGKEPILLPSGVQIEPFLEVDEKKIEAIRYSYRIQNKKVILFLGRISREKRILTIIRYMKKKLRNDPSLVVAIVGTGVYSNHIAKWAKRHHLVDSIVFFGPVLNRDTADFYHMADVFVSGSKMETQGLTYIEAMTSKAVVLAQKDPVLEGVIKDGENGFIFNNKKEYLAKLDYILNNKDKLDEVREAARAKGLEYNSENYISRLQKLYQEAIEKHQSENKNARRTK